MRIVMLGTGAALMDPDRHHSAIAITAGGRNYLLDCGNGATRQLVRANIPPASVDAVFLSHLHFDHIADYPVFVIASWMANRPGTSAVIGPRGTRHFVDHLFESGAFAKDIEARVQYGKRKDNIAAVRPDVRECEPGVIFEDGIARVVGAYVEHIPRQISECFGVRFEAEGKAVAFSGDTAPCEAMIELARDADLLIHEATFPQAAIDFRKNANIGTWAHTSPFELGKIAKAARAKQLVATHFGHFESTRPALRATLATHMPIELVGPELMETVVADIRRNYDGPLRIAHDMMRIDI